MPDSAIKPPTCITGTVRYVQQKFEGCQILNWWTKLNIPLFTILWDHGSISRPQQILHPTPHPGSMRSICLTFNYHKYPYLYSNTSTRDMCWVAEIPHLRYHRSREATAKQLRPKRRIRCVGAQRGNTPGKTLHGLAPNFGTNQPELWFSRIFARPCWAITYSPIRTVSRYRESVLAPGRLIMQYVKASFPAAGGHKLFWPYQIVKLSWRPLVLYI